MEDPIASRDAARRVPLSRKSSVILNSDSETTIPSTENSIQTRKKAGIFILKLRGRSSSEL
ncbi:unnamed protein product [Oikopleura dioica]|uniref:Uncharacterized protein n=1 Tax=Oikopleura dioica TaxID=34765 RepID=E4WU05_OIKDI|nr:unnamed protein product [Oikopleura dioica]